MSSPFLAEVKIYGFNFAPRGWAACDGQILPISQNQSLYSLLGTMYGGDGRTNFALPDLRGRVPLHVGPGHPEGQKGGEEGHALSVAEIPQHNHQAKASNSNANSPIPAGKVLARALNLYRGPNNLTDIHADTLGNTGNNQPHENMQPFIVLNFCIALQGLFPPRN